jgi:hypothetical protein
MRRTAARHSAPHRIAEAIITSSFSHLLFLTLFTIRKRCSVLGFERPEKEMTSLKKRLLTLFSAAAFACTIGPLAASAETPSYANPAVAGTDTIRGTIASVNGKYNISVRDERGFIDDVTLHDGTIINPTGLTLAPGQAVTIDGTANGATLIANEIDTPYSYYAYPYAGYSYGYPGPVFGVGFGFRDRGHFGFHGGGFHGGFHGRR